MEKLHFVTVFRIAIFSFLFSNQMLMAGEYMKKADDLYRDGKFLAAISVYRQALAAEENPPITHFNIGNCWFQLDSLPQAAVNYEETLREAPEFSRAYLNLGIVYFNMNQFGSAISTLERGRIEDPTNVTMVNVLAESYRKLNKYELAIPLLEQLLEMDSSKIDILFTLAEIYRDLNDPDGAVGFLNRYPDTGRRLSDKYFMLSEIAEKKGGFSEALFFLNQYASLNPADKWPHYKIIGLLQKQGNPLSAVFKAQETVKTFPGFSDAALLGGNIAFTEKQFRYAEDLYRIAFQNGSAGGVTGLSNINRIYLSLGDRTGSERINSLLSSKQRQK